MKNHLINKDFSHKDKRSITAMLRGYGDKRELDFLKFAEVQPELDELELLEAYSLHMLEKVSHSWLKDKVAKKGVGYLLLFEAMEILLFFQIPGLRNYLPF